MTDGVSAPMEGDAKPSEAKASGEERRKKRKDGAAPPTTN
jgi:hypothetical protein